MQKIPLLLATPGMIIAHDVFRSDNPAGMPICGKDTVLTESLIARLKHLNVATLYVEGHPIWENGDRTLEDELRDLDRRFEKVHHDPLTEKLYEIYADFLKRSMGGDSGRQAE